MVLNDIIEQAAGRQSGASDHGGKQYTLLKLSLSLAFPSHSTYS